MMMTDQERAQPIVDIAATSDLPGAWLTKLAETAAEAIAAERERVCKHIQDAVKRDSFERGGLWFVQNTAVYGAINEVLEGR
jgi:hypothetical protein